MFSLAFEVLGWTRGFKKNRMLQDSEFMRTGVSIIAETTNGVWKQRMVLPAWWLHSSHVEINGNCLMGFGSDPVWSASDSLNCYKEMKNAATGSQQIKPGLPSSLY